MRRQKQGSRGVIVREELLLHRPMRLQLPLVTLATLATQPQQLATQDLTLATQDQVKVLQAFIEALHGIVQDLCRRLEWVRLSSGHAINFGNS